MAFKIDPNKVAAKAAEEAKKAAQRGTPKAARLYWKPKQGKNRIRIMPAWTDQGTNALQFWREIYVHWGVGTTDENRQHLSCPKLTPPRGEPCPVCEEYERLRSSPDPAEKEAARELRPRDRAYSNIIDLDDPTWTAQDISEFQSQGLEVLPKVGEPKIQIFSYGPKVWKELLDLFCDDPNICDLDKGNNIIITREGQGLQTEYRVRPELQKTAARCKGEPSLHNLDEIMPFRTGPEMLAIMQGIDVREARAELSAAAGDSEGTEVQPSKKAVQDAAVGAAAKMADALPTEGISAPEVEAQGKVGHPWVNEDGEFAPPDGYPECFGLERDITDEVCSTQCEAFKECRDAVIFRCKLEGVEPSENALEPEEVKPPPSKKVPKRQPARKAAVAEPAEMGTKAVAGGSAPAKAVGGVEDLESRMKAAISGAR